MLISSAFGGIPFKYIEIVTLRTLFASTNPCLALCTPTISRRNHFQQSYSLQVQWILEPVFARLGVRHESRNVGNAGVGTIHNAIGSGSIYGPDVDILMYDSMSTEDGDERAVDLFARQAILGV